MTSDIHRDYHNLQNDRLCNNLTSSQMIDDEMIFMGSNQTLGTATNNNTSPFALVSDPLNDKENNELPMLRHNHDDLGRGNQQRSGSNTTLTTETSGYMTTDNSNINLLTSNNNNASSNPTKVFSQKDSDGPMDIVMDSTALHAADLSMINQFPGQRIRDRQQLFYRKQQQQPAKQSCCDTNFSSATNPLESQAFDLHGSQNVYLNDRRNIYQNFKIVPKPIPGVPNAGSKPVLVFVNPRSGGNQGAKMMQKFNWLLNPRQVFDLIQSNGPRAPLELYRDVPNLRILTIGGDGTASWILSHLDEIGMSNRIPVAVLPLGTGNDLARALGWGGGYADEPIAKVLSQVRDSEIVQLDRWNLHVERNHEAAPSSPNEFSSTSSGANIEFSSSPSISSSPSFYGAANNNNANTASTMSILDQTPTTTCDTQAAGAPLDETGSDRLPMDVINNYFSFGVDAHIALEFHTAREAHPERFSSRLRNKMFYGQAGGKDLLKRKWKDLSNFVTLYCDGQDMTGRLKELKVHSVLFLNIPSYGGGTRPWPTTAATAFRKPRTDDGLIEVIGLTTYQLPLLQAGGHGTSIAQCRNAKIITSRTIPMQVDGEPCKLLPSIITISLKNRVCMLAKSKGGGSGGGNQAKSNNS